MFEPPLISGVLNEVYNTEYQGWHAVLHDNFGDLFVLDLRGLLEQDWDVFVWLCSCGG